MLNNTIKKLITHRLPEQVEKRLIFLLVKLPEQVEKRLILPLLFVLPEQVEKRLIFTGEKNEY